MDLGIIPNYQHKNAFIYVFVAQSDQNLELEVYQY